MTSDLLVSFWVASRCFAPRRKSARGQPVGRDPQPGPPLPCSNDPVVYFLALLKMRALPDCDTAGQLPRPCPGRRRSAPRLCVRMLTHSPALPGHLAGTIPCAERGRLPCPPLGRAVGRTDRPERDRLAQSEPAVRTAPSPPLSKSGPASPYGGPCAGQTPGQDCALRPSDAARQASRNSRTDTVAH